MDNNKKTVTQQKEANRANSTWSTVKVEELMKQIDDGYVPMVTPFWEGSIDWRAANLVFEHTPEEFKILKECAEDVVYFSNSYAFAMTDYGIKQITLRPYQEDVMKDFKDYRHNVFLSPRQSGKCIEYGTIITVKNKDTDLVMDIPIGRFFYMICKDKDVYDHLIYALQETKIFFIKLRTSCFSNMLRKLLSIFD